jgi:hypothetical protein
LRDIYADIEKNAGRNVEAQKLRAGNLQAMSRAARRNPLYVNQYFMNRAKRFMDVFAREVLDLEFYWGRVEFAPGRGAIHLHLLGIAKDKAYLRDFYKARTEAKKVRVMEKYANDVLGMTADVKMDETYKRFHTSDRSSMSTTKSPLGRRYSEATDADVDHVHLTQDAMLHSCTEYCLGDVDKAGLKLRTCRFGFGTEKTSNKGDTPGKDLLNEPKIEVDRKGIEHLFLCRSHSNKINQHSRHVLQAWRANTDVQLIIYRSNPDIPDVREIEAVCRYCTSYASKAHQTTKEEINTIQDVIIG